MAGRMQHMRRPSDLVTLVQKQTLEGVLTRLLACGVVAIRTAWDMQQPPQMHATWEVEAGSRGLTLAGHASQTGVEKAIGSSVASRSPPPFRASPPSRLPAYNKFVLYFVTESPASLFWPQTFHCTLRHLVWHGFSGHHCFANITREWGMHFHAACVGHGG